MALRSINTRDPRLQRALMRANAGGLGARRGTIANIYRQHAANELGQHLRFAQIQENRDAFNARMGLARDEFDWRRKAHKQSMRALDKERKWTIGGGLLNLGVSTYMGKQQADRQRRLDDQITGAYEEMAKLYKKYNSQMFPNTSILRHSGGVTNQKLRRYFK